MKKLKKIGKFKILCIIIVTLSVFPRILKDYLDTRYMRAQLFKTTAFQNNANIKLNNNEILLPYISRFTIATSETNIIGNNDKDNKEKIYNLRTRQVEDKSYLNYEEKCDYYRVVDFKDDIVFIGNMYESNILMPEVYNKKSKVVTSKKLLNFCTYDKTHNAEKINNEEIFLACGKSAIYNPFKEITEVIKTDYVIKNSETANLPTGEILIIGENYDKSGNLVNVLIFNPKTKGFKKGPDLHRKRIPAQIFKLKNGNILIVSGEDLEDRNAEKLLKTIELYNYKENKFELLGRTTEDRIIKNQAILIKDRYLYYPGTNDLPVPIKGRCESGNEREDFACWLIERDWPPFCEIFDIKKKKGKYTKICPKERILEADYIKLDENKVMMIGKPKACYTLTTFYTNKIK